jgi:hypothetical protein
LLFENGDTPRLPQHTAEHWLIAVLTFVLSQLPYAAALIRTWTAPDRSGLVLAMAAGATQILDTFFADLRYTWEYSALWPWLRVSLGLAVVIFAYLAWRTSPSRKGNIGLLISILFGFMAYTALAQIALAILYARIR